MMDKVLQGLLLVLLPITVHGWTCAMICDCHTVSNSDTVIICSSKQLTLAPQDIPTNVTSLDLSDNILDALDGRHIKPLHNLTRLDLRNNRVSRIDSWIFQKLPLLQELDLDNNFLEIIIPYMFSAASNLKLLSLGNNAIETVESSAFTDLSLDRLSLRDNKQLTWLSPDAFKGSAIQNLVLDRCGITAFDSEIFSHLSGSLKGLSASTMTHGLSLHDLSLSKLVLDVLHLIHNNLSSSDLKFMSHLNARYLDISENVFSVLDISVFANLNTTESLIVKDSGIEHFTNDGSIKNIFTIRELDISRNNLNSFPVDLLQRMTELERLNISSNPMNEIPKESAHILDSLKLVYMSNISEHCQCELHWFESWRNKTSTIVIGDPCLEGHSSLSQCTAPHGLIAWVKDLPPLKTGLTKLSIVSCKSDGSPKPTVSLRLLDIGNKTKGTPLASGQGTAEITVAITECLIYICTAANNMGNSSLQFLACPDSMDQKPEVSHTTFMNHSNLWILTTSLAVLFAIMVVIIVLVFVVKHRKHLNSKCCHICQRNVTDAYSDCSHTSLARFQNEQDSVWNAYELK